MTVKCGWQRGGISPGPAQCRERPLPDKSYCAAHQVEALARVQAMPESTRGEQPRRWSASYMVSGSSRD